MEDKLIRYALFLLCGIIFTFFCRSTIIETVLEVGFSAKNQRAMKELKRHLNRHPFHERMLLSGFFEKSDQRKGLVISQLTLWWFALASQLGTAIIGLCGMFLQGDTSIRLMSLSSIIPCWFFFISISAQMFFCPEFRKDPGESNLEVGTILVGVVLGGLYFIVMYALGLW